MSNAEEFWWASEPLRNVLAFLGFVRPAIFWFPWLGKTFIASTDAAIAASSVPELSTAIRTYGTHRLGFRGTGLSAEMSKALRRSPDTPGERWADLVEDEDDEGNRYRACGRARLLVFYGEALASLFPDATLTAAKPHEPVLWSRDGEPLALVGPLRRREGEACDA